MTRVKTQTQTYSRRTVQVSRASENKVKEVKRTVLVSSLLHVKLDTGKA